VLIELTYDVADDIAEFLRILGIAIARLVLRRDAICQSRYLFEIALF
jgi:hypothetical protein